MYCANSSIFQTFVGLSALFQLYNESTSDRALDDLRFNELETRVISELADQTDLKEKVQRIFTALRTYKNMSNERSYERNNVNMLTTIAGLSGSEYGMLLAGALNFARSWNSANNVAKEAQLSELRQAVGEAQSAFKAVRQVSETIVKSISAETPTTDPVVVA